MAHKTKPRKQAQKLARGIVVRLQYPVRESAEPVYKARKTRFITIRVVLMDQSGRSRLIQKLRYILQFLGGVILVGCLSKRFNGGSEFGPITAISRSLSIRGLYSLGARFVIGQFVILSSPLLTQSTGI
jgi:hypothetical protein